MIRVLIADDQPLMRTGFRMILDAEEGISVVGDAGDGHQALNEARRLRPDVVLMDIRMPRMDGLEATRHLCAEHSEVKVVVLTTFDLDEHVYAALSAGANGFLLKDAPASQLIHAIRVVNAGDSLLAPSVTRRLISRFVDAQPAARPHLPADLTPREIEVLTLMAQGLSNAEIAAHLFVADATVKTHVARVLAKLGVRDRVQAVVMAYRSGLAN